MSSLSVVIVTASEFARLDFLAEADQMTLPKAFAELRHGPEQLEAEGITDAVELRTLLASAEAAYDQGDNVSGAHLRQDFEELAFPGTVGPALAGVGELLARFWGLVEKARSVILRRGSEERVLKAVVENGRALTDSSK